MSQAMRWSSRFKYVLIIVSVSLLGLLTSCGIPFSYGFNGVWGDDEDDPDPAAPTAVVVVAEEFTLSWAGVECDGYRIYHRVRGATDWLYFGAIGPVTEIIINDSMLGYGEYEFAVTAIDDGSESAFHTSLDADADPTTGWYLIWEPPA
jgi:hypothetical protein